MIIKKMGIVWLVVFVMGGIFIGSVSAMAADVSVVANKSVSIDSVDAKTLKNIYLGKTSQWHDGQKIVFVLVKSSPAHKTFLKTYVKKTGSQFSSYWKKMVFTGKGTAPKNFKSEAELIGFVAQTPGAIGYTSQGTDVSGAKVLSVTP